MSESTEYLVKNHEKTFEIFNAIHNMEQEVLTKFDKAIRNMYSEWVGDQWFCYKGETLDNDSCINISHKGWCYKDEDGEIDAYIWPYLNLEGDNPIWSFLGLPSEDGSNSVYIDIWLSNSFKKLSNYQQLIVDFDEKNQDLLENAGFVKKGGKANRTYRLEIFFSNISILNGIQNDDWDKSLEQMKGIWEAIAKIDWEFLKEPINEHKKNNNYFSID